MEFFHSATVLNVKLGYSSSGTLLSPQEIAMPAFQNQAALQAVADSNKHAWNQILVVDDETGRRVDLGARGVDV